MVEEANLIMSYMIQYDFMPPSEGEAKWLAVVYWKLAGESVTRSCRAAVTGVLRAQLHVLKDDEHTVIADFDEHQWVDVYAKFQHEYEECTKVLNSKTSSLGPAEESKTVRRSSTVRQMGRDSNAVAVAAEGASRDSIAPAQIPSNRGGSVFGDDEIVDFQASVGRGSLLDDDSALDVGPDEVRTLRAENGKLRAENEDLRGKLATRDARNPAPADAASAYPGGKLGVPQKGATARTPSPRGAKK